MARPWPSGDHYDVLGVDRTASTGRDQGRLPPAGAASGTPTATRATARAEERFKEVSHGLRRAGRRGQARPLRSLRRRPPTSPSAWAPTCESATDFFDAIFGDLFGLGRKKAAGQDLRYTLELDFDEAALGCEKTIRFIAPGGLPAPAAAPGPRAARPA